MSGLHAQIGDRRKRDAPILIEQMLSIQELLEAEWRDASEQQESMAQLWIAETAACFFLVGYCGSMREFELPKALLTSLLRHSLHLEDGHHGHHPHAGVFFLGHSKVRSNAEKKSLVFLAAVMDSGLRPALWLDRLVKILEGLGIYSGWLFQGPQGGQPTMTSFSEEFYRVLFAICDGDPSLFEPTMDIMEVYHLARSLHWGATTRATNAGMSQSDIDRINRWNKAGEELIDRPMRVIYSDRKQMLETFLCFS
jgi:hypothetical protein